MPKKKLNKVESVQKTMFKMLIMFFNHLEIFPIAWFSLKIKVYFEGLIINLNKLVFLATSYWTNH
jgi:hypothetical protein